MFICRNIITILALGLLLSPLVQAAPLSNTVVDVKIIAEATGGKFKAISGKYFEKACDESLDYTAEVVDLNGDGRPEVFITVDGTCLGGITGQYIDLYIKGRDGRWKSQFGFPGIYNVLKTKNKGYPDIEIGGPGMCFPVWRWNGNKYDIHKKCR